MRDWSKYIANTKGKDPADFVSEGISYVTSFDTAMDFGCGAMADTQVIAKKFAHVDAVDAEPSVVHIAIHVTKENKNIFFFPETYQTFKFPTEAYDFFNAQNAIPFAGEDFPVVMYAMKDSIKSGGIFCGTFFGPEDAWADEDGVAIQSREQIEAFFRDWYIVSIEEINEERPTSSGKMKHWHIIAVIAEKR